jgi:hypothetical protein
MELWECVSRQRIKYVVDCYKLDGYEQDSYQCQNLEANLPFSPVNDRHNYSESPDSSNSANLRQNSSLEFFDCFEDFQEYLEELFLAYPYGQIELAIVETLVASWLEIPAIRGIPYLEKVHSKLRAWESHPRPQVTPAQFQQITGLDPAPVFGEYRNEHRNEDSYAKPVILH